MLCSWERTYTQEPGVPGRRGKTGYSFRTTKPPRQTPPTVHHHALTDSRRGDACPECGRGKLYKYQPATFLRIQGHTPFSAHRHVMERLHCNAFQSYQTASPSPEVVADGKTGQRYGYSARALKPDRRIGVLKSRTDIYSSGVLGQLPQGQQTALFETNIGHASEWFDSLLQHWDPQAPAVKLMSDALPSNRPAQMDNVMTGLCNVHARREFAELIVNFRSEVIDKLADYGQIWLNERKVKDKKFNPEARRDYHYQYSLPVMQALKDWGQLR